MVVDERDAVMDFEPIAATASDAGAIAGVHRGADASPVRARCHLASRLPVVRASLAAWTAATGASEASTIKTRSLHSQVKLLALLWRSARLPLPKGGTYARAGR